MLDPAATPEPHPLARLTRGPAAASDGIWERIGPLLGRNGIAARFYYGPAWRRFRKWERLFLVFQGGARRARRQILRHLDGLSGGTVLEVGIGDGDNLGHLPPGWAAFGVDLARGPLRACIARDREMRERLAWAEAEDLPFGDGLFDACYSVGGFNYFGDHERALAEMARVTRPGGRLVVADELPHIYRYGVGRLIPARFIRRCSIALGVPPEFIDMILDYRDDPEAAIRRVWPGATRHAIWSRLGYCYVAVRPDRPTLEPHEESP